jgi:hypothetical protein
MSIRSSCIIKNMERALDDKDEKDYKKEVKRT